MISGLERENRAVIYFCLTAGERVEELMTMKCMQVISATALIVNLASSGFAAGKII